jgi:hypothetical protein
MYESDNVTKQRPAVYPAEAGVVHVSDGSIEMTTAQMIDEIVIALCVLPARCVALDFTVIMDDLDSAASLVWNGGGINAAEDDVDEVFISASQVGRAAGIARSTLFPLVAPSDTEKLFGVHVTALTTGQAGTVRGILTYRAEEYGA